MATLPPPKTGVPTGDETPGNVPLGTDIGVLAGAGVGTVAVAREGKRRDGGEVAATSEADAPTADVPEELPPAPATVVNNDADKAGKDWGEE